MARTTVMRHDERLGHRFVEGVCARIPHESGAYFVRTNAQGFRDERDIGPKGRAFRIAFYGASFTAGDGVSNSERFSDLAGAQLGVEVLNLAVSGHGPDQSTLLFEEPPVRDADLVILGIAANTIDRIQQDRRIAMDRQGRHVSVARPSFALDGGQLVLRGVPVSEEIEVLHEVSLPDVESIHRARLGRLTARLRRALVPLARRLFPLRVHSEYDEPAGEAWKLMAAIVGRFHELAGDVPVVCLPLPTRERLLKGQDTAFQDRFETLDRPEEGLFVLNVTDELMALPMKERRGLTFAHDAHPTARGHALIADAVCAQLVARGLVGNRAALVPLPVPLPVLLADPLTGAQPVLAGLTLEVRWDHTGSAARIKSAGGEPRSEFLDESELAGSFSCIGTLPLTAINECLERERLVGAELAEIHLISTATIQQLAALELPREAWVQALAPCIRWNGAAECDVRGLLHFNGRVRRVHREATAAELTAQVLAAPRVGSDATDSESRWLEQRLQRLWLRRTSPMVIGRLLRLARHWEIATRRAREAVSPAAAPGRRGRLRRTRTS